MKYSISLILLLSIVSCVEPEKLEELSDGELHGSGKDNLVSEVSNGGIGIKNFTQLNMTYSKLTDVPTYDADVVSTFNAVRSQLPTSNDASSASGFHQLSATRLAFTYCEKYIDKNYTKEYASLNSSQRVQKLVDSFLDLNNENQDHNSFKAEVEKILMNKGLKDDDSEVGLVSGTTTDTAGNKKLLNLGCTAILSSSYVTLI